MAICCFCGEGYIEGILLKMPMVELVLVDRLFSSVWVGSYLLFHVSDIYDVIVLQVF